MLFYLTNSNAIPLLNRVAETEKAAFEKEHQSSILCSGQTLTELLVNYTAYRRQALKKAARPQSTRFAHPVRE